MTTTQGTLLGGKISYRQAKHGHRTGIEPVLLAAAVPARPGERVIEAGTGAGAALLCLAHRVPGVSVIGIEREQKIAAIGNTNLRANGFDDAAIIAADILCAPFGGRKFNHALANPPWRDDHSTASPDHLRRLAHHASADLIGNWVAGLAALLRPCGSLTLICSAAMLSRSIVALEDAGCGAAHILPLWPRAGRSAKIVLIQARLGARGGSVVLPGMLLHDRQGFTPDAEAVLRDGAALKL